MELKDAILLAALNLRDGYDPEYRRGYINALAECFAVEGVHTSDRMEQISAAIDKLTANTEG